MKTTKTECPIDFAARVVGDRWSLLILRDILLYSKSRFSELASEEGIATNILSDRLRQLVDRGVIEKKRDPDDRRSYIYQATSRGNGLAGLMSELGAWGTTHEPASKDLIGTLKHYRPDSEVAATIRSNIYRNRYADDTDMQ
ncbi:helix-turn-helix domain-containing protein [Hoeflea sp. CAU 1731]